MRQVGGISQMGHSDAVMEECEAEVEVTQEALDRALELLARWPQRRSQKG